MVTEDKVLATRRYDGARCDFECSGIVDVRGMYCTIFDSGLSEDSHWKCLRCEKCLNTPGETK